MCQDMGMSDLLSRISIRPETCGGRPCIRGLRTRVSDVLGMLAARETQASILEYHPRDVLLGCNGVFSESSILHATRKVG